MSLPSATPLHATTPLASGISAIAISTALTQHLKLTILSTEIDLSHIPGQIAIAAWAITPAGALSQSISKN